MFWILAGIVLILLIYNYLIKPHSYWRSKGAPQLDPVFIFGNGLKNALRYESFPDMMIRFYKEAGNRRYVGVYQMLTPILLIKDLELIKQIGVKDFDHFQDHRSFIPDKTEPLWEKNLIALKGQKWKDMRSTLSPSFTSSKMKHIFVLISECAETMVKHFLSKEENDLRNLEMKDICSRFATDVIASTAFGIQVDSLGKQDNQFYLMGKEAMDFGKSSVALKIFLMVFVPKVAEILKLKLFSNEVDNFFREIITKTIENREKLGITRSDMIQLLLEARKNGLKYEELKGSTEDGFAAVHESEIGRSLRAKPSLTNEDIAAQGLLFFLAGFDTVSSAMSFVAYELALNPDVQERLVKEIDETLEQCEGKLTYEVLMKMKYMDMVVSETLRKWPPAAAVDRLVTKPYTIEPTSADEIPLHLDLNDVVWISIYGIHLNPELYPNPEKFDPERFNDDNKHNIKPGTYLPFGIGPRNCIGSRFALLEIKTMMFHLLCHFNIEVTERTQIPLKMNPKLFNLGAEKGIWVALKRRTKEHSG